MMDMNTLEADGWMNIQNAQQGKLITTLLEELNDVTAKGQRQEFAKGIKCGICYMLSLEWLRLIITGDDRWRNNFGQVSDNDKAALGYYKQIANNFLAYAKRKNGLDEVLKKLSTLEDDKVLVELGTANAATLKDYDVTAGSADKLADALFRGENLMFIRLVLQGSGHRVAAYRLNETTLYFYDPNIGTIQIHGDSADELRSETVRLLRWLWGAYKTQYSVVRFADII